jgi:hypothetical protein
MENYLEIRETLMVMCHVLTPYPLEFMFPFKLPPHLPKGKKIEKEPPVQHPLL